MRLIGKLCKISAATPSTHTRSLLESREDLAVSLLVWICVTNIQISWHLLIGGGRKTCSRI